METDQKPDISDGEIVDDDTEDSPSKEEPLQIKFSAKIQKNFRKSNLEQSEDEEAPKNEPPGRKQQDSRHERRNKNEKHPARKRQKMDFDRRPYNNNFDRRPFNARPNFRDRPDFRRNPPPFRDYRPRPKLPDNLELKYTKTLPIISYAENPKPDLKKKVETKSPKEPKKESPVKKPAEPVEKKQEEKQKSKTPEKLSFTPSPIPLAKDEEEDEEMESPENKEPDSSIPVVVESPVRSPVLQLPSTSDSTSNIFTPKSDVRNVCSFLSDIESAGYLSRLYDLSDGDEDNDNDSGLATTDTQSTGLLSSTMIEDVQKSDETDDDTDSSSSSSSSESSSSSSESEESESEESSNEGTPFASGFGRFDSSMNSHFNVPFSNITKTLEQAKSFEANILKPPLFSTVPGFKAPQVTFKGGLMAPAFQIPFKIYSLRDMAVSLPISAPVVSVQVKTSPKEQKPVEKEVKNEKESAKEDRRSRKSRSRSVEKRRRNDRNDRRKTPPLSTRRRSISRSPPVAKRRSLTPPVPHHKSRSSHSSRHSSPSRSRQKISSHASSSSNSRKPIRRTRSKERRSPEVRRKRSRSPEPESSRSNRSKHHKSFRESERSRTPISRHESPSYRHERQNSFADREPMLSDEDSQASHRKQRERSPRNDQQVSHDDSSYNSFYYQDGYREEYQDGGYGYMPMDQGYSDGSYYSSSKSFVNNYNLVDIQQQKRDRQRAESHQIAVQVGNVLEIVPNAQMPQFEPEPVEEPEKIDPLVLREKRKVLRDKKRRLKEARKEQLRKEIQKYFDEGINIEDSSDEEPPEPLKSSDNTIKGIMKSSNTEQRMDKKVMFVDGFFPHENSNSEHEEEKPCKTTIRKRVKKIKASKKNEVQKRKPMASTKKLHQEYFENIPPPPPPPGRPSEKCPQPTLKNDPNDLYAMFDISYNPIYYFLQQQLQNQQNNGHHKQPPTTRRNTSDPRLKSANNYNRF